MADIVFLYITDKKRTLCNTSYLIYQDTYLGTPQILQLKIRIKT